MNKNLLNAYYNMPHLFKNVVASIYGLNQKKKRYGGKFNDFVSDLEKSQWFSIKEQKEHQKSKLKQILIHASSNVPYYKKLFKTLNLKPKDDEPFYILSKLPILEKKTVREYTKDFIATNIPKRELSVSHTSGSTGTPLKVYYTNNVLQYNYALHESRFFRPAGISHMDRKVMFGGQLVVPFNKRTPPYWVYNYFEKQLYCSSYHISKATLPHYHEKICSFQPAFLTGYTSAIYLYAIYILEKKISVDSIKAILVSSETLNDKQKFIIEKAFKCKTFNGYSMTEYVNWASDCEYQNLHISPEAGVFEIIRNDHNIDNIFLSKGEIISTSLFNYVMPLIRYRTNDIAEKNNVKCPCGRELPLLEKITGRTDDYILTHDGKKIGRLDPIFKDTNNIIEAQIVQEELEDILISIVPTSEFSKKDANLIINNLRLRIGNRMSIKIDLVPMIKRDKNGKFRTVISKIN